MFSQKDDVLSQGNWIQGQDVMEENKSSDVEIPIDEDQSKDEEEDEETEIEAFPKSDLVLIVEGKELYVNREVLKKASPVFRAMLESNFKESIQDRIEIPETSYKAMAEFLKCTYPFINSHVTANNVLMILPLADFYQTDLKKKCEEFMINVLRGEESFFIYRTDIDKDIEESQEERISLLSSLSDVTDEPFYSSNDAEKIDEILTPGFGKNGFEFGNDVPAEKVVRYVLAAEKYTCEKFLIVAIQYIAMRSLSLYETVTGFSDISCETRLKITLLRLRIIENSKENDFDLESSFWYM